MRLIKVKSGDLTPNSNLPNFTGGDKLNNIIKKIRIFYMVIAVFASIVMGLSSSALALGPLETFTCAELLKMPEDIRATYVGGVLDGIAFTSYGYSLAEHDRFLKCARTLSLGALAQKTVEWLRANPSFSEGGASAVVHTFGAYCKTKGLR